MDGELAIALLSIFGGAGLATLGGLIGAWIQGRREHARWVREKRYEAYIEWTTLMNYIEAAEIGLNSIRPETPKEVRESVVQDQLALTKRFPSAVAPLNLLGPEAVSDAASEVMGMTAQRQRVPRAAKDALLAAMRKAIRVRA